MKWYVRFTTVQIQILPDKEGKNCDFLLIEKRFYLVMVFVLEPCGFVLQRQWKKV